MRNETKVVTFQRRAGLLPVSASSRETMFRVAEEMPLESNDLAFLSVRRWL